MSSSTAVLHRAPARAWSEQRSLATNTILALLIAVAGLVAAGSSSLVSQADAAPARTARPQAAATDDRDVARRSAALQAALLAEVAAQRGDALARNAQNVTRASLSQAGTARQQQLVAAQASVQAEAAKIAQQRLEAAVAARRAAADAGLATGATPDPSVDPTLSGSALNPVTGTSGALPAGTRGVQPVPSGVVGAKFGATGSWSRYHTGLDYRAGYGTPIRSVLGGVVLYAGSSDSSSGWAGTHVAVRHPDGRTTMYSHMSRMSVSTGQTVQTGQVLGHVGQTGRAFGAHLHFELYPPGVRYGDVYRAVDPTPYLRGIGVTTH